jgi:uncharacterized Ntn-hydrolase superfamily protein
MAAIMAHASPPLARYAERLLEQGHTAGRVLEMLQANDRYPDYRQLAVLDADGHVAASTGSKAYGWAGHIEGDGFVALGNVLVGERVVQSMAEAFSAHPDDMLSERLLRSIEAGRDAGGQPDGQSASFILVYDRSQEFSYLDLRVDFDEEPVGALRRSFEWYKPLQEYYARKARDPRMPRYHAWMQGQQNAQAGAADSLDRGD